MRVLLTGGSSFTGFWFAQMLQRSGATIIAPLRGRTSEYAGVRAERVSRLSQLATVVEEAPFGSEAFIRLLHDSFDALCHHGAQVTNYRTMDFDVVAALADNSLNARRVLEAAGSRGLKAVIVTGSVFEQDEGLGDPPHGAFSPYGLSKGLTWQVFRFWCRTLKIPLGKFVIPNPFGPLEEPRFCSFLVDQWRTGNVAEVRTPSYVRDNIHVDLLALEYARFTRRMIETGVDARIGVSGYRETQGAFAERFATEMRSRLGLACHVGLPRQTDFSEPLLRVNADMPDVAGSGWNESDAWDGVAAYHRQRLI